MLEQVGRARYRMADAVGYLGPKTKDLGEVIQSKVHEGKEGGRA